MKQRLSTLILSIITVISFAQQDAQFSHNMFNKLAVNPGYAGTSMAYCATVLYRNQWMGFPGAPKTLLFSGDAAVEAIHGGLGLTIFSDKLGFDNTFSGKLAYSFNYPLGPGVLGLGLEVGMMQKSLTGTWIPPQTLADASIPVNGTKNTTWDMGFGAYYSTDKLYFGLSSTHIPQTDFKGASGAANYSFDMVRHYYILAGYDFPLGSSFDLKPSVFIKSDATTTQYDVNMLALWNKMIWVGASYRHTDAIVALIGFQKDMGKMNFKVGYSYDVTTSDIKSYSSGTHEILLNFCFKIEPKGKIQSHQNVRFLR